MQASVQFISEVFGREDTAAGAHLSSDHENA